MERPRRHLSGRFSSLMWAAQGAGSPRSRDLLIAAPRFAKPGLSRREATGCNAPGRAESSHRGSEFTYYDNIFFLPVLKTKCCKCAGERK